MSKCFRFAVRDTRPRILLHASKHWHDDPLLSLHALSDAVYKVHKRTVHLEESEQAKVLIGKGTRESPRCARGLENRLRSPFAPWVRKMPRTPSNKAARGSKLTPHSSCSLWACLPVFLAVPYLVQLTWQGGTMLLRLPGHCQQRQQLRAKVHGAVSAANIWS